MIDMIDQILRFRELFQNNLWICSSLFSNLSITGKMFNQTSGSSFFPDIINICHVFIFKQADDDFEVWLSHVKTNDFYSFNAFDQDFVHAIRKFQQLSDACLHTNTKDIILAGFIRTDLFLCCCEDLLPDIHCLS